MHSVVHFRHFPCTLQAVPKNHGRSPAGFAQQGVARDLCWKGLRRQPLGHLRSHAHGVQPGVLPLHLHLRHPVKSYAPPTSSPPPYSPVSTISATSGTFCTNAQRLKPGSKVSPEIYFCSMDGRCSQSELTCSSAEAEATACIYVSLCIHDVASPTSRPLRQTAVNTCWHLVYAACPQPESSCALCPSAVAKRPSEALAVQQPSLSARTLRGHTRSKVLFREHAS